jgi:galactitol-specific phosphotransferase system IIC component
MKQTNKAMSAVWGWCIKLFSRPMSVTARAAMLITSVTESVEVHRFNIV